MSRAAWAVIDKNRLTERQCIQVFVEKSEAVMFQQKYIDQIRHGGFFSFTENDFKHYNWGSPDKLEEYLDGIVIKQIEGFL